MKQKKLIAVNDFVRRQVKGSGKTYAVDWTFEEIARHAEEQYEQRNYRPGYRDGVLLIAVADEYIHKFKCPYVKLKESAALSARLVRRQAGEEPYIQMRALAGIPLPAGKVELVLYRHDVLTEKDEQTSTEEWELISINALPEGVDKQPVGPVTMMRNQLELPGGTAAYYTSQDWAESVRFWQQYAALEPKTETVNT